MDAPNTDPTPAPPLQGRGKKQPLITKGGSVEISMKSLQTTAHFPAPVGEGIGVGSVI